MKLTKEDYQNALIIWSSYRDDELFTYSFLKYIEVKLDELEKLEEKMYKCIQLPPANNGNFKIGSLYSEHYNFLGFHLSDLPKHFELVVPEPEPEKITLEEAVKILHRTNSYDCDPLDLLNRLKTDHLWAK